MSRTAAFAVGAVDVDGADAVADLDHRVETHHLARRGSDLEGADVLRLERLARPHLDSDVVSLALGGVGAHLAPGDERVHGFVDGRGVETEIVRAVPVDLDKELRLLELEVVVEIDEARFGGEPSR